MSAWAGWLAIGLVACGQPAGGGGEGERAAAGAGSGEAVRERGAPLLSVPGSASAVLSTRAGRRAEMRTLGPGERRVALVVVPGDASVEVDGQPAWRRDGVIELVGKEGDEHRVRVFKGAKSTEEKTVRIEEGGASPAVVDLDAPPPPGARAPGTEVAKPMRFGRFDE